MTDATRELHDRVSKLEEEQRLHVAAIDGLRDLVASLIDKRVSSSPVADRTEARLQEMRAEVARLTRERDGVKALLEDASEGLAERQRLVVEVCGLRTKLAQWESIAERDHGKPVGASAADAIVAAAESRTVEAIAAWIENGHKPDSYIETTGDLIEDIVAQLRAGKWRTP